MPCRVKGDYYMTKQELKDKIGEQIERNLYYMSCVVTNDNVRKEFEKNIHLLHEASIQMDAIAVALAPNEDDYNRGLNDAWELAQKIGGPISNGAYYFDRLYEMFGEYEAHDIFGKFSYQEAIEKIEEYEKKKAEEAKLTRGDIVRFSIGSSVYNAIFLCEDQHEQCYWVLKENEEFPQRLSKKNFSLVKTGKHIDFDDLFKESRND